MNDIQFEGFNNFSKYKSLLSELVRKNISKKYRNSVLGVLWSFLDPLFRMVVLTIVFSQLFNRVPNYPVYYLSGQLVYTLFVSSSTMAMKSLVSSAGIWKSVYIPKYIHPLAAVLTGLVNYALSLMVLFAIMFVTHTPFTVYMIFMSIPILLTMMMALGVGLIVGTLNVFFRDVEHLYSVFTLVLLYALAIFYPPEIVPAQFKFIQTYNPLFNIVMCSRDCFLYGQLYNINSLIFPAAAAVFLLALGFFLLNKYQDKFILYI